MVEVSSFDHILNNFRASYCATAVLVHRDQIIKDLEEIFEQPTWQGNLFLNSMNKYQVSPENFMHRITNIVPKFFNIKELFYLRFQQDTIKQNTDLTKEVHIGTELSERYSNERNAHFCRRFIGVSLFDQLRALQAKNKDQKPIVAVQRIIFTNTEEEYFCISVARSMNPTPNINSSITIGFKLNKAFKKRVNFWNDVNIDIQEVHTICEDCPINDCQERLAKPKFLEQQQAAQKVKDALDQLQRAYV